MVMWNEALRGSTVLDWSSSVVDSPQIVFIALLLCQNETPYQKGYNFPNADFSASRRSYQSKLTRILWSTHGYLCAQMASIAQITPNGKFPSHKLLKTWGR